MAEKKLTASEAFELEMTLLEKILEELVSIKDELQFLNESISGTSAENKNSNLNNDGNL